MNDEVPIGWVDGRPIPASALKSYVAALAASPQGARFGLARAVVPAAPRSSTRLGLARDDALRSWAAKTLLVDRLVQSEAARLGLDPARSALSDWFAKLLESGELPQEALPDDLDDAEIFACYQANLHRHTVAEARSVIQRLFKSRRAAERFIAGSASAPVPGPGWARLGWVERGQLTGPLEETIFSALPGKVYGPVGSIFGWHAVAVEALRSPKTLTFDECKAGIAAELLRAKQARAFQQWWARRLATAISVAPGGEHPLRKGAPGLPHRH